MSKDDFRVRLKVFLDEARGLPESDAISIERTVDELSSYHYEPSLLLPVQGFTGIRKNQLIGELEKLAHMGPDDLEAVGLPVKGEGQSRYSAAEELKLEQASLLLYYYRQLVGLRNNDPEAWHVVDELYEDD